MSKNAPVAVNLLAKASAVPETWSPRVVAELNDYQFKVARLQGEFIWHDHPDTDEAFIVLDGTLRLDFREHSVELGAGDLFVVPKGTEHKPFAAAECKILLIEPHGTINTGAAGGSRTAANDVWI